MSNARQIINIVAAASKPGMFGPDAGTGVCANVRSDIEQLACDWQRMDPYKAGAPDAMDDLGAGWSVAMEKVSTLRRSGNLL